MAAAELLGLLVVKLRFSELSPNKRNDDQLPAPRGGPRHHHPPPALTTTDVSPQYSAVLLTTQQRRGVNGALSHQIWENTEVCSNESVQIVQQA